MIAIPQAVQDILAAKVAVGDNRPTGTLTIEDQPEVGSQSLKDPTEWTTWRSFTTSGKTRGNIAETADGQCVVIYVESDVVYLAFADTVAEILDGTGAFDYDNQILLKADPGSNVSTTINLIDGKLCAAIGYSPSAGNYTCEFWQDTDGNGTGMAKVADIYSGASSDAGIHVGYLSLIQKLNNGDYVLSVPDVGGSAAVMFYSDDQGATWTQGAAVDFDYYLTMYLSRTFMTYGEDSFLVTTAASNGEMYFHVATNSGADLQQCGWSGSWPDGTPVASSFIVVDGHYYGAWRYSNYYYYLYELTTPPPSATNFDDLAEWTLIDLIQSNATNMPPIFTMTESALILQHASGTEISGAGTEVNTLRYEIPIKSITVDVVKGGASTATAVIDNADGYYAPDNADSPFYQVIWPNKQVIITMGYGAEQETVFVGLIDRIRMTNYPAELTIEARCYAKRALDQMAQMYYVDHQAYVILYQSQSPEYIFDDLAKKAGWAAGDIHTGTSGIVLPEFTCSHENYADSFQRLAELIGWEWKVDVKTGDIYFQEAVEPDPVAVYVYTEGEDIFSLGYDFDDSELYRDVVVWSMTDDDPPAAVRATVEWSAADYNNVFDHKTLIVQADETVTTSDECAALAQKIANSITPKPRSVDFATQGNPYCEMGDCYQVIESTTTISELYRIFEYGLRLVSDAGDGSPFFANTYRAYHYAYAAIPDSVPEEYVEPETPLVIPDDYQGETFPVYPGGGIDVTADIQAQIDAAYLNGGGTVYLPEGEYWVDAETSIVLKTGVNLSLHDNAIIYALPNNADYYAILSGSGISNVQITGGQIIGDRNIHTGESGEHGIGIKLLGCNNIRIADIAIYNCWGDGIYIGSGTQKYCYNVIVEDFEIHNNRRNGIAVISGKYITIRNGNITYSRGIAPEDGIDLEPNDAANEYMLYVTIQDVVASYNGTADCEIGGCDVQVWFGCGTADPYAMSTSRVSIDIDNLTGTGNERTLGNVSTYVTAGYDIDVT